MVCTGFGALLVVRSTLLIRKQIVPRSFVVALLTFSFAAYTVISRPGKLRVILTRLLYLGEHERAFRGISGPDAFSVRHATSEKKPAWYYISIQSYESACVEFGSVIHPAYGEGLRSWVSA
jgi:hypothetical protein